MNKRQRLKQLEQRVSNLEEKVAAPTTTQNQNVVKEGKQIVPGSFQKVLDDAPITNEIGEPEAIKSTFFSKEDDGDQY